MPKLCVGLGLTALCLLSACANPAAPSPPSLKLPKLVANLAAERVGDTVGLRWTMPSQTTDGIALRGPLEVRVCRSEGTASCKAVLDLRKPPSAAVEITDALLAASSGGSAAAGSISTAASPASAASAAMSAPGKGAPRLLTYRVEVLNAKGRSAGLSNPAYALAGTLLAPPSGLSAIATKQGVLLRWNPLPGPPRPTELLLHRELLAPAQPAPVRPSGPNAASTKQTRAESTAAAKNSTGRNTAGPKSLGPVSNQLEPPIQALRVPVPSSAPSADRALDATARFGSAYRYTLQSVLARTIDGRAASMSSEPSESVSIAPEDKFPPSAPKGLDVALGASSQPGGAPLSVDLSWEPNTEPDIAGYMVYRRQAQAAADPAANSAQRINQGTLAPAPSFEDDHVVPGANYFYSVSAVDQAGNESPRSAEQEQDVPAP